MNLLLGLENIEPVHRFSRQAPGAALGGGRSLKEFTRSTTCEFDIAGVP